MRNLYSYKVKPAYKKGEIEYGFQGDILSQMRKEGYICHKIADTGPGTRFLDAICIDREGKQFLIEFKKVTGYTFNVSQFEYSQIILLEQLTARKSEAHILIYSQKTGSYVQTTYEYIKTNMNDLGGITLFNKNEP